MPALSADEVQLAQLTAAVLAVIALLVAAGGAVLLLLSRLGVASARRLRETAGRRALWAGFAVSATATVGSLYFSERVGYTPCELCWYQRIAMYPLAAVTFISALRRDRAGWTMVATFAVAGLSVSTWHTLIERFPSLAGTSSCSVTVPCTVPWFTELGLTLASMAGSGFAALLVLALLARPSKETTHER